MFADDFSGRELDPSTWNVRGDVIRDGGWELVKNSHLDGAGHLVLQPSFYFGKMATGAVDTRGKRQWKYGYFEIRCKLPLNPPGHRPAFWLQTQGTFGQDETAQGRKGTEIDVFEAWSRNGRVQHNLHWNVDRNGPVHSDAGLLSSVPIDYKTWHTFGVWWSPTSYRFYIDGKLSWQSNAGGVSQVPEYVLITDEVMTGDKLALVHAAQATNADPFVIDYFRVWQLNDPNAGS